MTQLFRSTLTATAAATAAVLALTACSSGNHAASTASSTTGMGSTSTSGMPMTTMSGASSMPMSTSAAAGSHNTADVTFATDMIPHHTQAVQMADMALRSASNAQVKALATAIKAAQDPEITQMSGWLRGWKQPVPAPMSGMSGTGMGHGTGMMSDADMAKLGRTSGAAFNRLWVQMMITHHQGAITMARTELTQGQNTGAKTLARSIVTSQSAQVTQLHALLTALPAA